MGDEHQKPEQPRVEGAMVGEIEVKRFHMPGVTIRATCPACSEPYAADMARGYFMYPAVASPFTTNCHCRSCDHDWTVTVRIDVTLSVVT